MANRTELKLTVGLRDALGSTLKEGVPSPTAVVAACLERLARGTGLADVANDSESACIEAAGLPPDAEPVLSHFIADGDLPLTDDAVRNRLYAEVLALAAERDARRVAHRTRPLTAEEFLEVAQIYWNLEAREPRTGLPIRYGIGLPDGTQAGVKAPYADVDLAGQPLSRRGRLSTPDPEKEAGKAYYDRGARLALLVAQSIVGNSPGPPMGTAHVRPVRRGERTEWSIGWIVPEATARPDRTGAGTSFAAAAQPTLEAAVVEAATRLGMLPGLGIAGPRDETLDPSTFLSGARMNGANIVRFAVPRRTDFDGVVLDVVDVAGRLAAGDEVAFLVAGAGEGKSTYLSALKSSLAAQAIVFTWQGKTTLEWHRLQEFRNEVLAAWSNPTSAPLPIVIVGELETRPTLEQQNVLIDIVQSIPAGLAPANTSFVLAGRPTWLHRVQYRVTTGRTMRLMPLSEGEAGDLIDTLARARDACIRDRGAAWTQAHFPNLEHFLQLPRDSKVEHFRHGSSLVGSLLHAAYGREFRKRLIAEYEDLEPAERDAYMLVSLATCAIGGISQQLLESICPDADVERSSTGSPWQRDVDDVHSARHDMIGKLVVEDKDASTAREISRTVGRIVEYSVSAPEAYELLLSAVRVLDESRSLVPEQQRKTASQFRAALRTGVLDHRAAWERLEDSVRRHPRQLLELAYILHRLLPSTVERGESNEYLLARTADMLAAAESAVPLGSPTAARARYHRVFVERHLSAIRDDDIDDLGDFMTLLPMVEDSWPEAVFHAQFLSLGVLTWEQCALTEDEEDTVATAVLQAWQRLRLNGATMDRVYEYSRFVSRHLYDLPQSRRQGLWQAAWEFSRALANPDGSLACILDVELSKKEKASSGENRAALRARRLRMLADSVVPGQDNAEVVLRYAQAAGADDESARRAVERVAGPLLSASNPATCSMASHALATVATSPDERLNHLSTAVAAYAQSVTDEDAWDNWSQFWKAALRDLRAISPEKASSLAAKLSAAGRRFAN